MKPKRSPSILSLFLNDAAALIIVLIVTTTAYAQVDRAELEGTVTDVSGAVVAGAGVRILSMDTAISQEQRTNSNGYYRFPGLAVGRYTVTVTGTGFKTKVIEGVTLQVGQTRTLDASLAVGAPTEKVEVTASAAPADRSSAEAATVIRADQIANLPNNNPSANISGRY